MYRVFRRTWWVENPAYPNGLEPDFGKKRYEPDRYKTEGDAQIACRRLNLELAKTITAKQRRLSLKYEYESC